MKVIVRIVQHGKGLFMVIYSPYSIEYVNTHQAIQLSNKTGVTIA